MARYSDGLSAVGNGHILALVSGLDPRFHITEDCFGVFITRVVGGQHHFVAQHSGYMCHYRALALVSVTPTAYNGNELLVPLLDTANRFQYIFQSIGGVGIIHDKGTLVRRYKVLEPPRYSCELA